TVAGAIALANSPESTPSTACACVAFAKYASRSSLIGAGAALLLLESDFSQPPRIKATNRIPRTDHRPLTTDHFLLNAIPKPRRFAAEPSRRCGFPKICGELCVDTIDLIFNFTSNQMNQG